MWSLSASYKQAYLYFELGFDGWFASNDVCPFLPHLFRATSHVDNHIYITSSSEKVLVRRRLLLSRENIFN